jgi:hypothetical protein
MNMTFQQPTFIAVLLVFALASCDKIEEAININIDSTETVAFKLTLNAGASLNESALLDLESNTDISKYLDQLKGVEITEASYLLKNFSGTIPVNGDFSFTLGSESFGPFMHDLIQDVNNAKRTTLDSAKLNTASSLLLKDKKITIGVTGSHDLGGTEGAPTTETLEVVLTLKLKFTASPL